MAQSCGRNTPWVSPFQGWHFFLACRIALCINDLDGFHKFHEQHGVVQQKGVAPPGLVLFYSLPTASLSLRGGLNSSPRFQRSCNVFATVIVYLMNNPGSALG